MNNITTIATLITEIGVLTGTVIPMVVALCKVCNGTKCQLRSEMLRIYYKHHEEKVIRQYEYENFVFLYQAYKALKGNSFIEKIYKEIQSWKIIS